VDDLIQEFLMETNESLDELDIDLVNLEQNPNDKELLGKIFRLKHTIKGTCGFLGLPRLEKVAHHAENVLGKFRDGELEVTPDYVTLIFESIDRIKFIVSKLEETGKEPEGEDSDIINKLDAAFEGKDISGKGGSGSPPPKAKVAPVQEKHMAPGDASEEELQAAFDSAPGPDDIEEDDTQKGSIGDKMIKPTLAPGDATEEELQAAFDSAPGPDDAEISADQDDAQKDQGAAGQGKASDKKVANQTLRVNVDVLEGLMTMVSELVLTRNQLLQILRVNAESDFSGPLQRLNHVVSDLQEGVMKTRMQPIGNAWSKLPRIIRDLSIELDKKIDLEMHGQDTELDRQVLEMIKDPLTHMVRNSGDHGIELPADRVAAGKPETGKIVLDAYHEGGHIIIKISDDGKGLSADKIKAKILEKRLATAEELAEMNTQQIQQFIFKAGFSTAEKVTAVSGRGVGMDVVRTNIEKIGGSVELKSTEGKGSTFIIKIPLTLAIVSALIVAASGERFAIPQLSVRELVMISIQGDNRIEYIKGSAVFRLRDRLLPLISLNDVLGLSEEKTIEKIKSLEESKKEEEKKTKKSSKAKDADSKNIKEESLDHSAESQAQSPESALNPEGTLKQESNVDDLESEYKNLYIVVTQVGGYDFGIIVDRVFDTEEIVVKPVAKILKDITLFSGNTILGDGSVIMILDPNGIANATGDMSQLEATQEITAQISHKADTEKKTSLLLFRVGSQAPKAVPLSLVARLEDIVTDNIEYSSGKMMVQYRDTLMPLVAFDSSVEISGSREKPVLVFSDNAQSMGLIVDEIIDIVEERVDVQLSGTQEGVLGSAIIDGKATDVVDVTHYLRIVDGNWFKDFNSMPFEGNGGQNADNTNRKLKVLLVDDSSFFRNMITPLLSVAGYEVTTLETPMEALDLCKKGAIFDVIVSDIEMPEMNGFEFARKVKSDGSWKDTPMVALTSHATPEDIERGIEAGYNKYVAKFDKDSLLSTLSQTLNS